MSISRNIFITGANRGIGLHLVRKLVTEFNPEHLFATFRDPQKSKDLQDYAALHSNVHLIKLDVRDLDAYDQVAQVVDKAVGDKGLNLLINNAGVTSKVAKLSAVRHKELLDNLEVNTIAPIILTKTLLPLLEKGSNSNPASVGVGRAVVVNMSSILGSIGSNDQGGMYAYRCSKAALNAATKSMSLDLRRSSVIAVSLHPGWVQTEMGGPKAPLTPEQATAGIVSFLRGLSKSHSGHFYQWDGQEVPW